MARFALFFLLLCNFSTYSQSYHYHKPPKDAIQISGNWSTHGTGDLNGYLVEVAEEHSFNRRFDLNNALAYTYHYYRHDAGTLTQGIQLSSLMNFNILHPISNAPQKIRLGVGPIFRYENASFSYSHFKVFTVGYQVAFGYLAQVGKKFQLGFKAGFQNDTDGAVITRIGLVFGRYIRMAESVK